MIKFQIMRDEQNDTIQSECSSRLVIEAWTEDNADNESRTQTSKDKTNAVVYLNSKDTIYVKGGEA